ncbi:GAF sensor protein [Phytophthora infestans T30-4]|uniref:GAF sensor protein n=1 Tax=Phytophthora infestans (strain T30-4) TaxID=403677 RepID=D0NQT5_PHYIT|nr:GAF sensor protein [Phytophthora infestans T30-4]EEY63033.1 GAF sensor protein [Phytophthora infestans T30-4]|eukprot:XP_002898556.1 GAF sensor protein [Phytophthora infestans T30-4]
MSSRSLNDPLSSKDPWAPYTPDNQPDSRYTVSEAESSVTESGTRSQRNVKGGVQLSEMEPNYSPVDPDDDLDILHETVAATELRCHLNEALSVLLHQDSNAYDTTMKALYGKRFKKGEVLFRQRVAFDTNSQEQARVPVKDGNDETPQKDVITVASATLRPSAGLLLPSRHRHTQQLLFSTCTHQYPDKKRAVHVMKTVPKSVHDQVLPSSNRSSLRRQLDHIAVGFDLQLTPRPGGSSRQMTRIFAHAYASDRPSSAFREETGENRAASVAKKREAAARIHASDLSRRRTALMNPEARHVMRVLTESVAQFERVIRRRRFGFQSFIYFPKEYADPFREKRCSICSKSFHFFRRDFYCQLCGHMVCGDCSQLYEVEARIGEVRKNRCCVRCVVRVDSCKFDDEDLLPDLGPILVEAPPDVWESLGSNGNVDDTSSESDMDDLPGQLCFEDPETRIRALEMLGRVVGSPASSYSSSDSSRKLVKLSSNGCIRSHKKQSKKTTKTQSQRVRKRVENHVTHELARSRLKYTVDACDVSDRTRDYKYEFDSSKVTNEDHPLAPMPDGQKDARRVDFIQQSGALRSDYDRSALNMIAQVAAERLACPIGFVSMVDDAQFHAIGNYNLPVEAHHLPHNENMCIHAVYADKPLVVKNPQRDMRFAQMPCVEDLGVKFYAGFPLRAPNGEVVGSLCAADGVAHNNISTKDYATMETLAKLASDLLAHNNPQSTKS